MKKEVWIHCYVCGQGIRESEPKSSFAVDSSLVCHEDYSDYYGGPDYPDYRLETHIDNSNSQFYLCMRCAGELEFGFKRLIRRIEKKFGSKKRWMVKKRRESDDILP